MTEGYTSRLERAVLRLLYIDRRRNAIVQKTGSDPEHILRGIQDTVPIMREYKRAIKDLETIIADRYTE